MPDQVQKLDLDEVGLFPICAACGIRLTEFINERQRGLQCLFCKKKFPNTDFDAQGKLKRSY